MFTYPVANWGAGPPLGNYFGSGAGGDVTISTDTSLTATLDGNPVIKHYNNLTIDAGNFLTTEHTRRWFREELFIPSPVVDRDFRRDWESKGRLSAAERAHRRVEEVIAAYEPKGASGEVARELESITLRAAQAAGMDRLPELK